MTQIYVFLTLYKYNATSKFYDPELQSWEILMENIGKKRIVIFELQNLHRHFKKNDLNFGSAFNIGTAQDFLVVNWERFSEFNVYIFCPHTMFIDP